MNTENDTDHEMEEILRGAGLETTPELDQQVNAAAGRALSPAFLPRLLKIAAAAMLLFCCGAIYISWKSAPVPEEPSLMVGRSEVALPPSETYLLTNAVSGEVKPVHIDLTTMNEATVIGGAGGAGGAVGGRSYPGPEVHLTKPEVLARNREAVRLLAELQGALKLERAAMPQGNPKPEGLIVGHRLVHEVDALRMDLPVAKGHRLPLPAAELRRLAEDPEWRRVADQYGQEREAPSGGEEYDRIVANPFRNPRNAPLSTFSVDVDTASYANVRRFLSEGRLPPADAVRVEEMINYFSYGYPQPEGDRPFSVVADAAECPWNPKYRLVRIGVQGRRINQENVPPRNLVFLLDVSGSMKAEDKLPLVKSAMKLLVGELRPEDRVGIVTYASGTNVVLEPTTGDQRFEIIGSIDKLTAAGSTDAGSGIQLAYELARRHFEKGAINRVLLATDGDFNVGITDRQALEALITREREDGVFLTVLGVGTGNIKDSQMEMLADKGNGNYAYLDSILEAQKVLVHEAGATLITIAKDVKIQVEFNPARVAAYRLVGYENRMMAARDFNDDSKDAGEIGAGHSVTALYEVIPTGVAIPRPTVDPLRYQKPDAAPEPEVNEDLGDEMLFLRLRHKEPDGTESKLLEFPLNDPGAVSISKADNDFAFAAAVAVFGKILRNSPETNRLSLDLVSEIATGALGADENGYRKEFLELVKKAGKLGR